MLPSSMACHNRVAGLADDDTRHLSGYCWLGNDRIGAWQSHQAVLRHSPQGSLASAASLQQWSNIKLGDLARGTEARLKWNLAVLQQCMASG